MFTIATKDLHTKKKTFQENINPNISVDDYVCFLFQLSFYTFQLFFV